MNRMVGKSQFNAIAAVATVAAGGSVIFFTRDHKHARDEIKRQAKRFGVRVSVRKIDNDSLRVSP